MILVANGCSFTSGTPDSDLIAGTTQYTDQWHEGVLDIDGFDTFYQYVPYAWPFCVDSEKTINLGLQGSSNERIVRTTMNFLDKVSEKTLKECVFVICWTMCNRSEYWYKNVPFKTEVGIPGHYQVLQPQLRNNPEDFYVGANQNVWMEGDDHITIPQKIYDYELFVKNMSKDIYDTLIQMATLKQAFDFYGIDRYLYTSIFWQGTGINCVDDAFAGYTDWHQPLLNIVKDDHLVEDTTIINHLDDMYFADGHLSIKGNREFGTYIQKELENRNWLI